MKAKATSGVSYNFWPGVIDGDTQYLPSFSAGEKWEETSITFTASIPINRLRFCFGAFQGELCFDDVTLTSDDGENLIVDGTFDTGDLSHWTKPSWMGSYTYEIGKEGSDNVGFCLTMTNTEKKSNTILDRAICYIGRTLHIEDLFLLYFIDRKKNKGI